MKARESPQHNGPSRAFSFSKIPSGCDKRTPQSTQGHPMAWTVPWNLIGLQVSGDWNEITIYTDKNGKKVAFPKAPPEKPPSPKQVHQRQRFKDAQAVWTAYTDEQKHAYENLCRVANVPMTGQNLVIHTALTNDATAIETLQRQTGITVPIPVFIP